MLNFAHPAWLLGVPVVMGLAYRIGKKPLDQRVPSSGLALRHPDLRPALDDLQHASTPVAARTSWWIIWLDAVALALLLIALAQPQQLGAWLQQSPQGREIMLVIDTSQTMSINDFRLGNQPVQRFEVLKSVVSRFVEAREGDRFGVIVFGSWAATLVPPTFDRGLVNAKLRQISVGVAGDNTALGDAIGLALKQLQPKAALRPAIILFSDGADSNAGALFPQEALEIARRAALPIYTVQVGPVQPARNSAQNLSTSGVPQPGLEQIARETAGRFYRAANTDALRAVIDDIGAREPTLTQAPTRRTVQALYWLPLAAAALLLALSRLYRIRTAFT